MPIGKNYTIESQITGEEIVGGLQFEVTPLAITRIYIEPWQGERKTFFVKPRQTVRSIKETYAKELGVSPILLDLIFEDQVLNNGMHPQDPSSEFCPTALTSIAALKIETTPVRLVSSPEKLS
jgi:hypothetical protein